MASLASLVDCSSVAVDCRLDPWLRERIGVSGVRSEAWGREGWVWATEVLLSFGSVSSIWVERGELGGEYPGPPPPGRLEGLLGVWATLGPCVLAERRGEERHVMGVVGCGGHAATGLVAPPSGGRRLRRHGTQNGLRVVRRGRPQRTQQPGSGRAITTPRHGRTPGLGRRREGVSRISAQCPRCEP